MDSMRTHKAVYLLYALVLAMMPVMLAGCGAGGGGSIPATPSVGAISGTVSVDSGTLDGLTLEVRALGGQWILRKTAAELGLSGSQGSYRIDGIPKGNAEVRALLEGFASVPRSRNAYVQPGQTTFNVDFVLTESPPAPPF